MAENGHKIHLNTIKRLMRLKTNRPISKNALRYVAERIEHLILHQTESAEELINKRNTFRKIQGMKEIKRISPEIVKEIYKNM